MKPYLILNLSIILCFNLSIKSQTTNFSYYKADAITGAYYLGNGKYGQEIKQAAICIYLKKDNVFNKYSFYYVNEKRNKSFVYFDTHKGSKYVIASNRDHSVKNDHDLFLIDEYFLMDKLEKEQKLYIYSVYCPNPNDIFCNKETKGVMSARYTFTNLKKITKAEYNKNINVFPED